ncbi:hypothetical protein [Paenibacillus sp. Marseille-Q4541]|uniref:hypothetical protein n=1 Tax=Paenibacillus sp. Marseille-Q4541 TaxID=2831522 RepID=UPI001BA876CD|nr:hypothetical protein [Paenibacillus sp. Marseille-Q4541]
MRKRMSASDYAIDFDKYIRDWCQKEGLPYKTVVNKICGLDDLSELENFLASNGIDPRAAFGN